MCYQALIAYKHIIIHLYKWRSASCFTICLLSTASACAMIFQLKVHTHCQVHLIVKRIHIHLITSEYGNIPSYHLDHSGLVLHRGVCGWGRWLHWHIGTTICCPATAMLSGLSSRGAITYSEYNGEKSEWLKFEIKTQ